MPFLPEWMPNVHPLIVHFPIALLTTAVAVDVVLLFVEKSRAKSMVLSLLFGLGTIGLLAAYLTGRAGADALFLPADAQTTLTNHADLAKTTLWFFGVVVPIRLALLWQGSSGLKWRLVNAASVIVLAAGLSLIAKTSDKGGMLVFSYGVGVQRNQPVDTLAHNSHPTQEIRRINSLVVEGENGSWSWAHKPSQIPFGEGGFKFIEGRMNLFVRRQESDSALAIPLRGRPIMFIAGEPIESVQASVTINASLFEGEIRLVYSVLDSLNYDFLGLEGGTISQGRVHGGNVEIFDSAANESASWIELSAVSDGSHFRGYVDGQLLVHGHGNPPEQGMVGLRLDGSGTVYLSQVKVQALR